MCCSCCYMRSSCLIVMKTCNISFFIFTLCFSYFMKCFFINANFSLIIYIHITVSSLIHNRSSCIVFIITIQSHLPCTLLLETNNSAILSGLPGWISNKGIPRHLSLYNLPLHMGKDFPHCWLIYFW